MLLVIRTKASAYAEDFWHVKIVYERYHTEMLTTAISHCRPDIVSNTLYHGGKCRVVTFSYKTHRSVMANPGIYLIQSWTVHSTKYGTEDNCMRRHYGKFGKL
jgi:hypothetical protein